MSTGTLTEAEICYEMHVRYNHDKVRALGDKEAIQIWRDRHDLSDLKLIGVERQWIKGAFRLVLEVEKPHPKLINYVRDRSSLQ